MLIPFGLKDGKIHHVKNVTNGLACGCICPNCKQPLVAKNKGEHKRPHFAHSVDTDCFDYDAMTYLHRYAQQLLESKQYVFIPDFSYTPEITLLDHSVISGEVIHYKATKVNFDSVQNEFTWNQYRIDTYGQLKHRSLFIEITVTHKNEPAKIASIRQADRPTIEIVLTSLHNSDNLYNDKEIENAVFDPKNANWIHHPKAMNKAKEALKQLELVAKEKNRIIKMRMRAEERRRQQEAENEKKRIQNIELAKQRFRDEIKDELDWLALIDSNWIQQYDIEKKSVLPDFLKWIKVDEYSDLVGVKSDIDWIFECQREHWQALIICQLYRIGVNQRIKAFDVKRFVQKHSRVNPNMLRLNAAQYQARQKAKANGSQTNLRIAWYLSNEENRKIVSPFKVVLDYLQYLASRDVLTTTSDSLVFQLNDRSIEDFRIRLQKKAQEVVRVQEEEQRVKQEAQLKVERQRAITTEKKRKRISDMIEADRVVFNHYQGQGLRCNRCQFTSPKAIVSVVTNCPVCNKETGYVEVFITQDYLDTAIHRYQCNTLPLRSLEAFE
ncbi:hypothetical protein BCU33_005620 [Vibrio lentus]|uniref:hypothetical protein n=1 Tax=Vibrio lentus TaxID=136468 RepID=UPI000C84AD1E|nr:hypothetical protein [Vibrio lentus]PMI95999.1 hypothetical protein BCU33_15055 [Vibrio lentus]